MKLKIFEILDNTQGGVFFKSEREMIFVPQENLQAEASQYILGLHAVDNYFWEKIKSSGEIVLIQ